MSVAFCKLHCSCNYSPKYTESDSLKYINLYFISWDFRIWFHTTSQNVIFWNLLLNKDCSSHVTLYNFLVLCFKQHIIIILRLTTLYECYSRSNPQCCILHIGASFGVVVRKNVIVCTFKAIQWFLMSNLLAFLLGELYRKVAFMF